jgi:hypothetical protein
LQHIAPRYIDDDIANNAAIEIIVNQLRQNRFTVSAKAKSLLQLLCPLPVAKTAIANAVYSTIVIAIEM